MRKRDVVFRLHWNLRNRETTTFSLKTMPLKALFLLQLACSAHSFLPSMVFLQQPSSDHVALSMSTTETKEVDMKQVQALLWDIDGTLADSWKLGFDATQVVLKNNGINEITSEIYHECTRYSTPDRLARHAGLTPEDGDEYIETGNRLGEEFDNLYVGLVNRETADVRLGALTNACVDYAHAVLKTNSDSNQSLYKRFGSIRGADDVPAPKPQPDGLFQVCKDLDVNPQRCVYIGDSPSDAMAAKNAGMPSIGVLWGSHSEESLKKAPFTHLCRSIEELRVLLNVGARVN